MTNPVHHSSGDLIVPDGVRADQHPAVIYLTGLARGSRRTMASALNNVADIISDGHGDLFSVPWAQLRYQHTQAIRTRLMDIEDYAPSTINRHLSALRGVLRECWRLQMMSAEDYHRAIDVANVSSSTLLQGRMLQPYEITHVLRACLADRHVSGVRDAAIVAVMYVTGMRRSELVRLSVDDFDPSSGRIIIRQAKRNKDRSAYIQGKALAWMSGYLKARGTGPGRIFLTVSKYRNLTSQPLSAQGLYLLLERRGKQAGIDAFTPHDLRRTAISEMLRRGVDVATVARIVGHSDLKTTMRYDLRGEEQMIDAASTIDTPL